MWAPLLVHTLRKQHLQVRAPRPQPPRVLPLLSRYPTCSLPLPLLPLLPLQRLPSPPAAAPLLLLLLLLLLLQVQQRRRHPAPPLPPPPPPPQLLARS
jgi:hypothetical protein